MPQKSTKNTYIKTSCGHQRKQNAAFEGPRKRKSGEKRQKYLGDFCKLA